MNQDSAAFLRAIKGPVMMITIGTLFALDNFTPLGFSQTWPVLLVVAGLLSLGRSAYRDPMRGKYQYKAQWGQPNPAPPPPPPPPNPNPTAPPGSYRGSNYESSPGATTRPSENKETRSTQYDPGATQ